MLCALKPAVVGTDSSTRKSLLDKNDSFEYCALCYGKKKNLYVTKRLILLISNF